MKGVFVIIDGVADEQLASLGMKTPLQYAKTPNLDKLASLSTIHSCQVIKEGVAPESSSAILSLLGYDPMTVARGPLEAMGAGAKFSRGDLVLRTNFGTVDDLANLHLLDRRAGRTLSTKEAKILGNAIRQEVKLPYKFEFYPTVHHRGVVVFKGGFSDNISNIDPSYHGGRVASGNERVLWSRALDDHDSEAKVAADLVNKFVRRSHEILDVHPLNKARAKKGLYSANFLLCRDPGIEPPRLAKLKGKWMGFSYMPLEIGIAKAAKMDVYSFGYPALKGIDVYENLYHALKIATSRAVRMLRWYHKKYDYFFIHFKETDVPGHDNKPLDKVRMIEMLDQRFFSYLVPFVAKRGGRVVITGDHTTSCRLKEHTDAPVPVLFYNPANISPTSGRRFTEEEGMKTRPISGRKLLDKTLFSP